MFKFFELISIRSRMVGGFLFLTILILIPALVSLSVFERITRVSRVHSSINQLQIYTLSLIKSDNDFFDIETINENYFKHHESHFLLRCDSLSRKITFEMRSIINNKRNEDSGIEKSLNSISLVAGAILFSLLSEYWISKRLSEPIARLSKIIRASIISKNHVKLDLNMLRAAIEVKTLGQ